MINLKQLYIGFVNSYNSLILPASDGNHAQDTHAIIEWFRRTGLSLGFYPHCEAKRRDLEWYDDGDNVMLHFECENYYSRIDHTINKLIKSDASYRIGLIWTNDIFKDIEVVVQKAANKSKSKEWEMLIVIRFVQEVNSSHKKDPALKYPVRAWLISSGTAKELDMCYIIWPKQWGYQTAEWAE